ncbi:hypothetical protein DWY50_20190 [Ruminococcus sp. AF25-28AC]|nr:hypothetical protein DWY50_20190 [Ruminococcus sp. AF25-28AC]
MLLLIPFSATCFSIFAVSEKNNKKLQTDIIYYRIISMEKQQNMPSGYEKDRKIIGKYQSFH